MSQDNVTTLKLHTVCVGVCSYSPITNGQQLQPVCQGCHRTSYEISNWSSFTDELRQKIIESLPIRDPWVNAQARVETDYR